MSDTLASASVLSEMFCTLSGQIGYNQRGKKILLLAPSGPQRSCAYLFQLILGKGVFILYHNSYFYGHGSAYHLQPDRMDPDYGLANYTGLA